MKKYGILAEKRKIKVFAIFLAAMVLLCVPGFRIARNHRLRKAGENLRVSEEIAARVGDACREGFILCQRVFDDETVRVTLRSEAAPDGFSRARVVTRINALLAGEAPVESVYLYNGASDTFVCTEAVNLTRAGETAEYLRTRAPGAPVSSELRTVYDDVTRARDHRVLTFVSEERDSRDGRLLYAAAVNLSVDALAKIPERRSESGESLFLALPDGTILSGTVSGAKIPADLAARVGTCFEKGGDIFGVVAVPGTDWLLVSRVDNRSFAAALRWRIPLAAALTLAVCSLLGFAASRMLFAPVARIAGMIPESAPEATEKKKRLPNALEEHRQRLDRLEQYCSSNETEKQKSMLRNILVEKPEGVLPDLRQTIGGGGLLRVAVLKIRALPAETPRDAELLREIRSSLVTGAEAALGSRGIVRVIPLRAGTVSVLLWPADDNSTEEAFLSALRHVSDRMYEAGGTEVCGIADACDNTAEALSHTFRCLSREMHRAFFYGGQRFLRAADREPCRSNLPDLTESVSRLAQSLADADAEKAGAALAGLLERASAETPSEYRRMVSDTLRSLREQCAASGKARFSSEVTDAAIARAEAADTALRVREAAEEALADMLRLRVQQMEKKPSPIAGVKTIIDEQYADKSLCGKMLAARLGLSVGYLYTLFKEEYGISLPDYLNRVRLEKAHALVIETDLPISRIVESCGMETSAFYRLYKATYGTSPKEQRIRRALAEPGFAG